MKEYLKLLCGSKLYGLTNKQSDEDYDIICVDKNDPELEPYVCPSLAIFNIMKPACLDFLNIL